ncbi:MAG: hypothetical protein IPM51_02190 [Sphingobacteriaceae bacterium]|nr:hypothetical protein [Sphingobacteriaceae bacterium]
MKKINYKKILHLLIWTFSISGLLVSFSFVSKSEKQISVNRLNISILNNTENQFLSEADIRAYFEQSGTKILNQKFAEINIPKLERLLNVHPAIENAEVSAELNGEISVNVLQRTPICRIINADGESYYIDSQNKLMPLNENYSARVIVVNGNLNEPFARRYQLTVDEIAGSEVYKKVSLLDDIVAVVHVINQDSTLSSLIHQININEEQEIELFPAIGNHKIVFGEAKDIEQKFNRLKLFYTEGLNKADAWNKYSIINLKYKNQVVCTKK